MNAFPARQPRRVLQIVAALAAMSMLLWTTYAWRIGAEFDALDRHAGQRLALLSASLDAALLRFESLPAVLAQHPLLQDMLTNPGRDDLRTQTNLLLEQVNDRTGSALLYLLAPSGHTLAASNWQRPDSLVGQNYAFRPYLREALQGGVGRFYAVGATTSIPGLFIAHPVRIGNEIAGVIAVKIELSPLEQTWAAGGESVMVVDRHGVAALSSVGEWKFGTLAALDDGTRQALAQTRQYFSSPLPALPLTWLDARRVRIAGREYLVAQRAVPWVDWEMLMLLETQPVYQAAWLAVLAVALVLCLLGVVVLYWRQRARRLRERLAAQEQLERMVETRTADLAATNVRLTGEIVERASAEHKLRSTQRALIEANRLAALGQMAAGVAHELNQPLAAMRTFAGNGLTLFERGQLAPLKENLQQIIGLVERMGRLTSQLKVFASRQQAVGGQTDAAQAVQVVAGWFRERFEKAGLTLDIGPCGERIPLQQQALEQVLSNLIGNAFDALQGRPDGVVAVRTGQDAGGTWLEVTDNGPGIDEAVRERITQPFFSTKPLGQGLGLGLSIVTDLVEATGGRLEVADRAGGAAMRVCWPATAQHAHGGGAALPMPAQTMKKHNRNG